jgi:hypothetical protein
MFIERAYQRLGFGRAHLESARVDQNQRVAIDLQVHRIGAKPVRPIRLLTVAKTGEWSDRPVALPWHIETIQQRRLDAIAWGCGCTGSGKQAAQRWQARSLCAVGESMQQKQLERSHGASKVRRV